MTIIYEISNKLAACHLFIYTEHEVSIGGATVQSYAVRRTALLVVLHALNSFL